MVLPMKRVSSGPRSPAVVFIEDAQLAILHRAGHNGKVGRVPDGLWGGGGVLVYVKAADAPGDGDWQSKAENQGRCLAVPPAVVAV